MMQVFSLGLSSPVPHPVNIYGWFSVRDGWEPRRNYLFKRSREDPAMISQAIDTCSCHELKLCKKEIELCVKKKKIYSGLDFGRVKSLSRVKDGFFIPLLILISS